MDGGEDVEGPLEGPHEDDWANNAGVVMPTLHMEPEEWWSQEGTVPQGQPSMALSADGRTLAVGAFAVALYAFYVLAALPSVDPVAGLARHSVEGASLCASAVVVFGVVGLAERF